MRALCVFSSLIAAVLMGTTAVMATPELQVQLSGPSAVNGANNFKVSATITNTGDETLTLLNDPRGPLSKIPAETFSIVHESGDVPEFVGVKVCAFCCIRSSYTLTNNRTTGKIRAVECSETGTRKCFHCPYARRKHLNRASSYA